MMPSDSDKKTIYEQCVNSCADSLYRTAYRLTGNDTLACELIQETYFNAWKSLDSLADPTRIRAWIFSILRFQFSKLLRAEKKSVGTSEHLDAIQDKPTADSETTDWVQNALNQLDEKHKMPLLLVSMEGMSVDEASQVLEIPRGTVLSRLHRGRDRLRKILNRESSAPKGDPTKSLSDTK